MAHERRLFVGNKLIIFGNHTKEDPSYVTNGFARLAF